MGITFFHEILLIDIAHGNDDLFVRWSLGDYVDVWLRFGVIVSLDDLLDILNVGCLDFQHFLSVADILSRLSI